MMFWALECSAGNGVVLFGPRISLSKVPVAFCKRILVIKNGKDTALCVQCVRARGGVFLLQGDGRGQSDNVEPPLFLLSCACEKQQEQTLLCSVTGKECPQAWLPALLLRAARVHV